MTADKITEPMPEITFAADGPRDAQLQERLRQDKESAALPGCSDRPPASAVIPR